MTHEDKEVRAFQRMLRILSEDFQMFIDILSLRTYASSCIFGYILLTIAIININL